MIQHQHQTTASPDSIVIAESLQSGRPIDKKHIDFVNMTNEEHKKFLTELRRHEEANLQIAMAISIEEHKSENSTLEEHKPQQHYLSRVEAMERCG